MNIEILRTLDNIARVSIEISDIYDKIIDIQIKGASIPDYEERLTHYSNRLLALKAEEDNFYDFFEDAPTAIAAYSYLIGLNQQIMKKIVYVPIVSPED